MFLTGGLTSGHNRWFDKSIQIMCTENGKAGLQGEHSMMDGMPVISFSDYITKNTYADAQKKSGTSNVSVSSDGGVENIFAKCNGILSSGDSHVTAMVEKGTPANVYA